MRTAGRLSGMCRFAVVIVAMTTLSACVTGAGLSTNRSTQTAERSATDVDPDADPDDEDERSEDGAVDRPPPVATGDLPSMEPVVWGACQRLSAPWQCGEIIVPLDYHHPRGALISVALSRWPASDPATRIGSLVVNPGGPGGSGISLAAQLAPQLVETLGDRFDIVGFDPRGVGASSAVSCTYEDIDDDTFDACVEASSDLLPHLGTINVARDLEMIRRALGDAQLTYLGYSYGTAIGGVYANLFPTRVRALVLDGAIDPLAGSSNDDIDAEYRFYAESNFSRTADIFHRLCDASPECESGPDSREVLDHVRDTIEGLPADDYWYDMSMTRADLIGLFDMAMFSTESWGMLAIALADADAGDASTLAAMYDRMQWSDPGESDEDWTGFANVAVTCADFGQRSLLSCNGFPESADPLPVIDTVNTRTPTLVIGTVDDPATPGAYAPQLARALGDAVVVMWEGAGHTAFLTDPCVTALTAAYLVDLVVPTDGHRCPFVEGALTAEARGDVVFGPPEPTRAADALRAELSWEGLSDEELTCVVDGLLAEGDERVLVHALLGVESTSLTSARARVDRTCS